MCNGVGGGGGGGGGGAEDDASEVKVVSEDITILDCRMSVRVLFEVMVDSVFVAVAAATVSAMVVAAVAS